MKHALRLTDYLEHMQQAASTAISYVQTMAKAEFLQDRRTQQAVVFNLIVLGEAASNVLSGHAAFAAAHAEVPWRVIRATRNRVARLLRPQHRRDLGHGANRLAATACDPAAGHRGGCAAGGNERLATRLSRRCFLNTRG